MRVDTAHFLLALQSLDLINHGRTGHPGPLAAMACDGESLWLVSLDPKCELWWRLPAKYATSCFPAVYIDVRAAHAQLDGLRHHLGPEIKIEWDRQRIEYGPGVQAATPRRQRFQPPTWFYEPAHGDRFNPAALRRVWLPMLPALRYFMQDGAHASYFYGDGMWNALSCGDHTFSVRHAWGRPVTACTVRPYFIWTRAFPALDIAMQQDTPVYCAASRSGHEVHLGQPYVGWLLRSIVPAKDRCAPPLAAAYRLLAETKTAPLQDMAETLTQMDAHTPIRLELYGSKLTVSSAEHARTFKIAEEVHERYRWIVSSSALALSLLSARANASLRLFTDAKATELMLDQGDASPVWALASYREEPVETVRLLPAPLRRQVAHILGG